MNPVTGSRGITREGQVFFIHLMRIATDPDIGAVAVKGLVPVGDIRATVIIISAAAPPTLLMWTLSHG